MKATYRCIGTKDRKPLTTFEDIQAYILELEEQCKAFENERKSLLLHIDKLEENRNKARTIIKDYFTNGFDDEYDMLNNIDNVLKGNEE